ncbi:hypothetical protein HN018_15700 [Lichenicola cladoniae]|uniref:Antifreeze protein n=1 Tax=Lichenicola cladoniae TaxID=1484109 RepID=A0A6M8HSX5_9PROT|nr:hypothetical protein [Lichenicola cladoniae]NPD65676.1 hypothetical protein [Acetobacteraceae bacterium]QKE91297.1 hypothetical protein HN018_15700 [Lichenicola cladoniae]
MRNITATGFWSIAGFGLALSLGLAGPAQALSMKECSVKYAAAKKDGTLNGQNWKAFRAAECSAAGSAPTAAATPATTAAAAPAATAAPMPTASVAAPASPAPARAAVASAAPAGNAAFPSAIDTKYASLKPGKARMSTCLDQYKANKAAGGNGGLKWIQKGGGYYSECNKRLKGA